MPEVKDPAIKLFGKTIHLDHVLHSKSHEQQQFCSREFKKTTESKEHEDDISSNQSTSLQINDDPKTPTSDQEIPSKTTQKNDNPITDSNSEEKAQKPDKILPCPRCNSMDTKFCYYNNYNVNQPRHFCKNCQRYWTAGGTMRNTPVGSGRRKNKSLSSASYYPHLIVSDDWLKTNGSVLNFGSDVPLCESMNQALKFSDKSLKSEDDYSNSASNSVENSGNCGFNNGPKCPVQIPCFSPHPWCYQWNSAHYRPPVNLYNSGFPANFYPIPSYWGMPMGMQLMNPNSPLGKHSRNGNLLSASSNSVNEEPLQDKDSESLRTNDSNKAAKSSIWSTIGMPKDENGSNSINGRVLSKAFQSKIDESNEVIGSSLTNLQANPAALSRSLNFRETS